MSQAGSLVAGGGGGGGGREGDIVQTGVGAVGAVMDDGLEENLGAILGMLRIAEWYGRNDDRGWIYIYYISGSGSDRQR